MFDPRMHGAKCDQCPLATCRQGDPVPPEEHIGATIALVGDYPGDIDVREGRPFVGHNGNEMMKALRAQQVRREDVHWTNAVLCQPPGNDLKRLLARIQSRNSEIRRENNRRAKDGYGPLPLEASPLDCCRPRLAAELSRFEQLILAGSIATKSVTGASASILDLRGGMMEGRLTHDPTANTLRIVASDASEEFGGAPVRAMPTLHPSFVTHSPKWTVPFRTDVARAIRWFRGILAWSPPRVVYQPTPDQLAAFLLRPGAMLTFDYETDSIDARVARVRCLGIGDADTVYLVGILSKDGISRFYTPADEARVLDILREFFVHPQVLKIGHNSGYYDRIVTRSALGVDPAPMLDTILLHRLVESELPHNLAFVGSVYTDVHSWKTDREGRKLAFDSETDEELHAYCALDVAVTARVMPPLYDAARVRQQDHLIACDHRIQRICADMHEAGMWVNQTERAKKEKEQMREVLSLRAQIQDAAGMPDLNPGSTLVLRRLLFTEWKLDPQMDEKLKFTESGDPSTSDDVIRACLAIPRLTDQQRVFLKALRNYRSAQKMLGTYIVKLRPMGDSANFGWDEDESAAEREEREKRGYDKKGIVWPDGRMRPGYNAHVTVSGRLSSSRPINAQNFPKALRSMVQAQPGHVLVGADADQLELRIAAARWQCKLYLDAFASGADPHSMTALAVFGKRFADAKGFPEGNRLMRPGDLRVPFMFVPTAGKWTEDAYKLRNLAKMVQYASQYGGSVETLLRLLQMTEDENGDLVYLAMALREVRLMHGAWLEGAKEFPLGWEREVAFFRNNGFISEPVMGRRRDCLDGEDMNEIVNFPIQGAASSLINKAMIQIADAIPLHKWGPGTGLVTQTHDALVVECPADGCEYDATAKKWVIPEGSIPWQVQRVIEGAMCQRHESLPGVEFTATADVGLTWKEVG